MYAFSAKVPQYEGGGRGASLRKYFTVALQVQHVQFVMVPYAKPHTHQGVLHFTAFHSKTFLIF